MTDDADDDGTIDQLDTSSRAGFGGIDVLRMRHQLDDCCVTELRRFIDAYLTWVAAGTSGRSDVTAGWHAGTLAEAADHGAVAPAFADFLGATGTGAREIVDEFARALASAGHELEPMAQYVLATSALIDADPAAALAALEPLVETNTTFAPAVDVAAVLLADAGRPVDALAARRRATSLGWQPADTAVLQSLLRQNTKAGRNDPCPCGSGRKYKQCCQREPKFTTSDRRRLALHQVVRHAVHGRGREELWGLALTAADEAMRPGEQLPDVIRPIMLDPFMIDIATFETDGAAAYLRERGAIIPTDERAWLEQLADTPLSLWSCDRQPDGTYRARDVMSGQQLDGVRFPKDDHHVVGPYVLARMMADGTDGVPAAVGPALSVDGMHARAVIELLDGFGEAHDWARWVGRRIGGVAPTPGEIDPGLHRMFFALPEGGWDAARPALDALCPADGDGWLQFIELDDERLARARLTADGDELIVATSSLRRLSDLRDALEQQGFRMLRSELHEPDDDDGWGVDDWNDDWDEDDDPDDGDPEALAAALRSIDEMFDRMRTDDA